MGTIVYNEYSSRSLNTTAYLIIYFIKLNRCRREIVTQIRIWVIPPYGENCQRRFCGAYGNLFPHLYSSKNEGGLVYCAHTTVSGRPK